MSSYFIEKWEENIHFSIFLVIHSFIHSFNCLSFFLYLSWTELNASPVTSLIRFVFFYIMMWMWYRTANKQNKVHRDKDQSRNRLTDIIRVHLRRTLLTTIWYFYKIIFFYLDTVFINYLWTFQKIMEVYSYILLYIEI